MNVIQSYRLNFIPSTVKHGWAHLSQRQKEGQDHKDAAQKKILRYY